MSELIYEVVEAGYDQNNPVPKLQPVKINSKIYIFNRICGIVLEKRGKKDNHAMFTVISNDDDFWYSGSNLAYDSYWLEDFKELIEKAGYSYSDNITKETTYLIADDVNGNSSKLKKAREKGIKIITENEFFNLP